MFFSVVVKVRSRDSIVGTVSCLRHS